MEIKKAIMAVLPEIPELEEVDFSRYSTPPYRDFLRVSRGVVEGDSPPSSRGSLRRRAISQSLAGF